jgi:hypothetical protein
MQRSRDFRFQPGAWSRDTQSGNRVDELPVEARYRAGRERERRFAGRRRNDDLRIEDRVFDFEQYVI